MRAIYWVASKRVAIRQLAFELTPKAASLQKNCPGQMRELILEHFNLSLQFIRNPILKLPVLIQWASVLGGSLHHPVMTYYFLSLGATEVDIGHIGFVRTLGFLVLAPLFGRMFDKKGPQIPILLSSLFCAIGCFILGFATNVTHLLIGSIILGFGSVEQSVLRFFNPPSSDLSVIYPSILQEKVVLLSSVVT